MWCICILSVSLVFSIATNITAMSFERRDLYSYPLLERNESQMNKGSQLERSAFQFTVILTGSLKRYSWTNRSLTSCLCNQQSPAELLLDQSRHAVCMSVLVWDRSPQPAACFLVPLLYCNPLHDCISNIQQPTIIYHHRSKKPKDPQLETGSYKYMVSIQLCSVRSYLQLKGLQVELPFSLF